MSQLRAERSASPTDQAAVLPAMAPAELLPSDAHPTQGMWGRCTAWEAPRLDCRFSGSLRAGWSDLRVEAWRARPLDPERVAPGVTGPSAIGPVTLRVDEVLAVVDPGFHRSGNVWLAVLTGVAPDGVRYRLTNGSGETIDWRPTLLEWLAAPD